MDWNGRLFEPTGNDFDDEAITNLLTSDDPS
jgi:hypothetical protein